MKSKVIKVGNRSIYSVYSWKPTLLERFKGYKNAIICLHGGPGYPHNYLENISTATDKYPIIFYDQIGCGKSIADDLTGPIDISDFVAELELVRSAYKIEKIILYGHSWGSILALEYYLKYPNNVSAIIFASPCISIPWWLEDSKFYLNQLSSESKKAIELFGYTFRYFETEYIDAVEEYYRLCVYDKRPKPEVLLYCDQNCRADIYGSMWGPNEFTVTGRLKNYDRTTELHKLNIPTHFISGENDECRPETTLRYSKLTPNSSFEIIRTSRHLINIDNFTHFKESFNNFLVKV